MPFEEIDIKKILEDKLKDLEFKKIYDEITNEYNETILRLVNNGHYVNYITKEDLVLEKVPIKSLNKIKKITKNIIDRSNEITINDGWDD